MSTTLTKLDLAPEWVRQIFREIDTLAFGPSFDHLTDATEMTFGTAKIIGVEAISSDPKVITPLMQIFTMDPADATRVSRWSIVNGPINTDAVI